MTKPELATILTTSSEANSLGFPSLLRRTSTFFNHDFCPGANRYVYWLKQPVGWFLVIACAGAMIGAFIAPQGWFVAAVVLFVAALGTAWPWLAMRGLSAEILFGQVRCREQDSVTITLTVTNRWPWPVWGLLVERGFADESPDGTAAPVSALARVAGWSRTQFKFEFAPPRRGVYPCEPPRLTTGFPFGLFSAQRSIVARGLIVWPRYVSLHSLPLQAGDRLTAVGSLLDRAGHDGDIIAARHYRQGDSLRRIHWAHTARRDTLIVCERQTAAQQDVTVALDPTAFRADSLDERDLLDWALRVMASLCHEFQGHNCELSCELNGESESVQATPLAWHRLLDRFAQFAPQQNQNVAQFISKLKVARHLHILVTTTVGWNRLVEQIGGMPSSGLRAVVFLQGTIQPLLTATWAPWIQIDIDGDSNHQLRQQWEKQCHDEWGER